MKRKKITKPVLVTLLLVFLILMFPFSLSTFQVESLNYSLYNNISDLTLMAEKKDDSRTSKLLLSVTFYVYPDIVWLNATWDGNPIAERSQQKHSDDYWFMYNALRHSMRTMNETAAKLFVIPTLNNIYDTRHWYKHKDLCFEGKCNVDLMNNAAEQVTQSISFRQSPQAHSTIASHYAHGKPGWNKKLPQLYKTMLQQSANIHFEDKKTNLERRWSAPKIYVSTPCPFQPLQEKTQDLALIAALKENDHRFKDRGDICSWLNTYNTTFRMEFCGSGPMCPTLSNAKLGFHVRGDSHGSSRLFDTILSGTIPIFTLKKQYHILPQWFQWNRISYFIDMKLMNETEFVKNLQEILSDTNAYREKLDLLLKNLH